VVSLDRTAVLERPRVGQRPGGTRSPRRPAPTRFKWRALLKLGLAAVGLACLLGGVTFVLLFVADYNMAGTGSSDPKTRAGWVWERGDHLHYGIHLVLGRVFDLCPCSRNAAGAQYYYAKFHAVTPRQKAVITNIKPANIGEWAGYISGPSLVWFDWIGDGIAWLGGQRPTSQVTIALDQFAATPDTIRIARGTTVTWRNVDELGEAHTVTAGPGQLERFDSDFLVPGERFAYTFTERGSFVFFCREHGEPIPSGMAGTVIVE
jgi:plastocyanin